MVNVSLDAWRGRIGHRTHDPELVVELPLKASPQGGSGTFLASMSDGQRWWVKPLNNPQGPMVPTTEYVVGRLGAMIGAPTCEVAVVEIPSEIAGWEFRPGHTLEPGLACASLHVPDAQELRGLDFRVQDDNRRRHAGVFALYDWCWGGDDQWLYCESDDRKLHSHDHGWYLPDTGPSWSAATLVAQVDTSHLPAYAQDDLDADELRRLASALRGVSPEQLSSLLSSVPAAWPPSDADLEALGFFLEARTDSVAARLEALL